MIIAQCEDMTIQIETEEKGNWASISICEAPEEDVEYTYELNYGRHGRKLTVKNKMTGRKMFYRVRNKKREMKTEEKAINTEALKKGLSCVHEALKEAIYDRMKNQVQTVKNTLEENDWDMKKAYPFPDTYDKDYKARLTEIRYVGSITKTDAERMEALGYMINGPEYVMMKEGMEEKMMKEAEENATFFIDSFSAKLSGKIAKEDKTFIINSLEYTGSNDPFLNSVLTVRDEAGREMKWSTKCIVNFSCLGKVFNQWPTRKMK